MGKHKTSVFSRLMGSFLFMEVIVLLAVGMLLFHFADVQEETDQAGREELAVQTIAQLEEQIDTVYGLADSLCNDTRLSRIAYHMYPNEYEWSQIILGLMDSMRSSCELNTSIETIQAVFPEEKLLLSSTGNYDNAFVVPPGTEKLIAGFLSYDNGRLQVQVSRPAIATLMEQTPDFTCQITFAGHFFQSALTAFGDSENQGALLILQRGEDVIPLAVSQGEGIGAALLEKIEDQGLESLHSEIELDGGRYGLLYNGSHRYPLTLIAWRNVDRLSSTMVFTLVSLLVVILVAGTLFLLLIFQANRRIARPIYRLMYAFEQVGKGHLNTRIHPAHNDEFAFIYDSFNVMTSRTERLIDDIKEQHSLLQNAELMQLQAQIDPHFLYNSFNVIKYMANGEEYEQITQFVSALAQYYRFINKEVRQVIPLASEVQHMETYLYIQQMRFAERIHVEVKGLPENAEQIMVPKLILQPLVENCYNHGLKSKLGEGMILVEFSLVGNQLYISVSDNGDTVDEEKVKRLRQQLYSNDDQAVSHALANIYRRLELAYGERDLLTLSIGKLGGLCVTLRFDLAKSLPEYY